jgi:hypothetical protein
MYALFMSDPPRLEMELPLPPPKGHLLYEGHYRKFPKPAYRDWLQLAFPLLREALGDWEPDSENWWAVGGKLYLSSKQKDGHNYLAPILDMLSGMHYDAENQKLAKGPGLWRDDKKANLGPWHVVMTNCEMADEEPRVELFVNATHRPQDGKLIRAANLRVEREAAVAAKEAERDALRFEVSRAIEKHSNGGKAIRYAMPSALQAKIAKDTGTSKNFVYNVLSELRSSLGIFEVEREKGRWKP